MLRGDFFYFWKVNKKWAPRWLKIQNLIFHEIWNRNESFEYPQFSTLEWYLEPYVDIWKWYFDRVFVVFGSACSHKLDAIRKKKSNIRLITFIWSIQEDLIRGVKYRFVFIFAWSNTVHVFQTDFFSFRLNFHRMLIAFFPIFFFIVEFDSSQISIFFALLFELDHTLNALLTCNNS